MEWNGLWIYIVLMSLPRLNDLGLSSMQRIHEINHLMARFNDHKAENNLVQLLIWNKN